MISYVVKVPNSFHLSSLVTAIEVSSKRASLCGFNITTTTTTLQSRHLIQNQHCSIISNVSFLRMNKPFLALYQHVIDQNFIPHSQLFQSLTGEIELRVIQINQKPLSKFGMGLVPWQPTSVFLPGKSQEWGEPGGLPSMGLHRVGHD